MTGLWTVVICLIGIVGTSFVYFQFLKMIFKIPLRANEEHWVKTSDVWQIRFCRYYKDPGGEPVFLCHSALANHYNFAIPEGKSMVDVLVEAGYDCWVIDLRGNRSSIPPFGKRRSHVSVDDHLMRDIPAALNYVRNVTGYAKVHWIGHSYGGMLLYAYEQVFGPDYVASGTTLGSPPGFKGVGFKYPSLILLLLRISPGLVSFMLRGLTPLACLVRPRFHYLPINWNNMNPEIGAAEIFNVLETAPPSVGSELAFWASNDIWSMNSDKLDVVAGLASLQVPLFVIYGGDDPLTPWDTAQNFFCNLPNKDKQLMYLAEEDGYYTNYNHVDLAFAVSGVEEVFEPIADWLKKHPITEMIEVEEKIEETEPAESEKKKKAKPKKKTSQKRKTVAKKKTVTKKKTVAKKKAGASKKTVAKKKTGVKKKEKTKKTSA